MKRIKKKKKKNALFTARHRLSKHAHKLLLLCLTIHIAYDLFLIICIHSGKLSQEAFSLDASSFLESQYLSLLLTAIGTFLFDLEVKRYADKSHKD